VCAFAVVGTLRQRCVYSFLMIPYFIQLFLIRYFHGIYSRQNSRVHTRRGRFYIWGVDKKDDTINILGGYHFFVLNPSPPLLSGLFVTFFYILYFQKRLIIFSRYFYFPKIFTLLYFRRNIKPYKKCTKSVLKVY